MKTRIAIVLGLIAIVGLAMAFRASWRIADLRPPELRERHPNETTVRRGRELLEAAANAHRRDRWASRHTFTLELVDRWTRLASLASPWPEREQELRVTLERGTWNCRFEIVGEDEVRGIQDWNLYRIEEGAAPEMVDDRGQRFHLSTFVYFFEFPFRIPNAELVANLPRAELDGRRHHRVLATWGTLAPTREWDQFVVWIDEETKLVSQTEYTVRDLGGGARGIARFLDYRDVDGVMLPGRITIHGVLPGGGVVPVHTIEIRDIEWDAVDPAELRPLGDVPPAEGKNA